MNELSLSYQAAEFQLKFEFLISQLTHKLTQIEILNLNAEQHADPVSRNKASQTPSNLDETDGKEKDKKMLFQNQILNENYEFLSLFQRFLRGSNVQNSSPFHDLERLVLQQKSSVNAG